MTDFPARVKALRRKMGLTQEDFARKIGLSHSYVSKLETGTKSDPSPQLIKLLEMHEEALDRSPHVAEPTGEYTTPCEIMRAARQAKGWSIADLTHAMGYKSVAAVRSVEEGRTRASERMIADIARALDISKESLLGEQVPEANGIHGTFSAIPNVTTLGDVGPAKYIPLIGEAAANSMTKDDFTDGGYANEGTLAFDVKDRNAVAIRITGDSMEPKFSAGDIAVVYPNSPPQNGKLVIVRLREEAGGSVVFKLYTPMDGGNRIILSSYNPVHPPMEITRADTVWIYPVVAVMKLTA